MSRRISSIRVHRPSPRPAICFVGVGVPALFESAAAEMPLHFAHERLREAFGLVFNSRLPQHAQAALRSFWRAESACLPGCREDLPHVVVEPAGSSLLGTNALAATNGIDFHFLHPLVALAPDDILASVIGHELAHAFLRIHRHESDSELAEEAAARTVVLAWGGDEDAVDRWAAENSLLLST